MSGGKERFEPRARLGLKSVGDMSRDMNMSVSVGLVKLAPVF